MAQLPERSSRMREIGVRILTSKVLVKTGIDNSIAKRSTTGVSVTGPRR